MASETADRTRSDLILDGVAMLRQTERPTVGVKDMQFPLLSLEEARRLRLCQVCRLDERPRFINGILDPLALDYGKSNAHCSCLKRVGLKTGSPSFE